MRRCCLREKGRIPSSGGPGVAVQLPEEGTRWRRRVLRKGRSQAGRGVENRGEKGEAGAGITTGKKEKASGAKFSRGVIFPAKRNIAIGLPEK